MDARHPAGFPGEHPCCGVADGEDPLIRSDPLLLDVGFEPIGYLLGNASVLRKGTHSKGMPREKYVRLQPALLAKKWSDTILPVRLREKGAVNGNVGDYEDVFQRAGRHPGGDSEAAQTETRFSICGGWRAGCSYLESDISALHGGV